MEEQEGLQEVIGINVPIAFHSISVIGEFQLVEVKVSRTTKEWKGLYLKLKTDHLTYQKLEEVGFFHNTQKNRLEMVEGGFNPDFDVYFEIALHQEHHELLPAPTEDLETFFKNLEKEVPLLQEKYWKALFVWTEIELDASIGGGIIKVGYKTIFSEPSNEIDALKRLGAVSAAIVIALIESSFPVDYEKESECFLLNLRMENSNYLVFIKGDNENNGLTVRLKYPARLIPETKTQAVTLSEEINKEINLGYFSIENEHFEYTHHMIVNRDLVSHYWVTETLLAGLSLMHHYAPRFEALCLRKS